MEPPPALPSYGC